MKKQGNGNYPILKQDQRTSPNPDLGQSNSVERDTSRDLTGCCTHWNPANEACGEFTFKVKGGGE